MQIFTRYLFVCRWWQGTPNILQYAMVDVYTRDTCRAKHGNVIQDYHVCVGKKVKRP